MKKRIVAFCGAVILTVSLLLSCITPVAASEGYALPADLPLHAESAILVSLGNNAESDMVLYAKNADEVRAPGAMMRYMVLAYALHRIEEKGLNVDTDTGAYSVKLFNEYVAGTGVATANMAYGEEWTLRDLLTVSFIHNASDAVVVLAEAVDGDVRTFIDGMNTLAMELGCVNSHFYWLSGVDSLSQYSTARDMYRLVRYCQSFSLFEDLVSVSQVTVTPVKGGSKRTITTNNHLSMSSSQYYYAPLVCSRTGLSDQDGRTCAAIARKEGYEYLVVVMGCPEKNDKGESMLHYRDTKTLFEWAFKDFEYRIILSKDEIMKTIKVEQAWEVDRVNLVPAKEIATVVKKDIPNNVIRPEITLTADTLTAPVKKGTVCGKVELYINDDQKIGEVELVAAEDISHSELMSGWDDFTGGVKKVTKTVLPWLIIGIVAVVVLVGTYIVVAILHNKKRNKPKYSDFKPRKK